MHHLTLATATIATLAFAGTAYADSNYGPRQNGSQCWHQQTGNSLGYWSPCQPQQNARAQATPITSPARPNSTAATRRR
jgi:hypothetical protein